MKNAFLILAVIAAITVMTAGCTTQPAAPVVTPAATPVPAAPAATVPSTPPVPPQLAGDWTLTTLGIQGGTAVTYPTTTISLTFNQDTTLAGYDGCNNYFASYTLTGATTPRGAGMTISTVGSSKKFCADLANQEQQYLNILGKTSAYVVDGTQLTLTADTGDVLIYQRPKTLVTPAEGPRPA